ncbi:MAG: iron-sulfur cluster co-chaperone HscB C-terminal domain-containing protein [Phycisphaerales bacterium JB043]
MHTDPFELLGLDRRFDLSSRQVRQAWRTRAMSAHPDLLDDETHEVTRGAATLNDAMHTLLDPERRADTLVVLMGGPTREQDTALPKEFLGQMMEVRESFESALARSDAAEIQRWTDWSDQQRSRLLATVGELFESHAESTDEQVLRDIRHVLNQLRFIERMREQITPVDH